MKIDNEDALISDHAYVRKPSCFDCGSTNIGYSDYELKPLPDLVTFAREMRCGDCGSFHSQVLRLIGYYELTELGFPMVQRHDTTPTVLGIQGKDFMTP